MDARDSGHHGHDASAQPGQVTYDDLLFDMLKGLVVTIGELERELYEARHANAKRLEEGAGPDGPTPTS